MRNFITRQIYLLDAFVSAGSGLVIAALAGPLADLFGAGLPESVLLAIGIGLLPWAAFNFWISRQPAFPGTAATLNIIGDLSWIVASLGVVMFLPLTTVGVVAVLAVELMVTLVCATKVIGLRRPLLAA